MDSWKKVVTLSPSDTVTKKVDKLVNAVCSDKGKENALQWGV
jgi:hypothetical protein